MEIAATNLRTEGESDEEKGRPKRDKQGQDKPEETQRHVMNAKYEQDYLSRA